MTCLSSTLKAITVVNVNNDVTVTRGEVRTAMCVECCITLIRICLGSMPNIV